MTVLMMLGVHVAALQAPEICWLKIDDIQGSYTIPYIQSERSVRIRVDFSRLPANAVRAEVTLHRDGAASPLGRVVERTTPVAEFEELVPGEYSLSVTTANATATDTWNVHYRQVGIGTVVAAIGDSLTEGYHGHGFKREPLDLNAARFPAEAVSLDGRNFPQFSPTTAHHKPAVNCFQSWMTRLNNSLSAAWKQPVFIANEGLGGHTSGHYLGVMQGNRGNWQDRIRRLQPSVWLIHLGVNDERYKVPADTFAANVRSIVSILRTEHGASHDAIYIARPSYDYAPGADAILREYIARIDTIVTELGLRHGPDFFAAFSTDREKWYGTDPVHPGPAGIDRMADLWLEPLGPDLPPTPGRAALTVITVPAVPASPTPAEETR